MNLFLSGHKYQFECENLCRLFFPYSAVKRVEAEDSTEELFVMAVIEGSYRYKIKIREGERELSTEESHSQHSEYILTSMLFKLFSDFCGYRPLWGMLTGIHPVKVLKKLQSEHGEKAADIFRNKFFVSDKKANLAERILREEKAYLNGMGENDYSLYIGIPFCPSRCEYCSFVSQAIVSAKKLMEPYFELLLRELEETAAVAKELGLNLVSVYIGGGTPTTLTAQMLDTLCKKVWNEFDMDCCKEFTVEAGRPDTITNDKLIALIENGVSRISINPQSLSDKVLENIGRGHTVKEVVEAFEIAKRIGFKSINSDLIVGLSGDDFESFKKSLNGVIELGASNVTVHALAIKRSANLWDLSFHRDFELAEKMVDYSLDTLTKRGFVPYYLYRQSRMAGNLENTGWSLPGDICRYNIYTMDESSTVIACGAGGVSKIKDPYSDRLERIFNFKYPYEYIDRNDEILERKRGVIRLYEQFRKRIY